MQDGYQTFDTAVPEASRRPQDGRGSWDSDFLFPDRRIAHLKEKIRLREILEHFGHNYRLHGNMLCCWHVERNPSARFWDEQDSYWCWVCSPEHGVDQIEFVIIELGIQTELHIEMFENLTARGVPPEKAKRTIRALSVFRAIEYLETAFNTSYITEPWERRLHEALKRQTPPEDPTRYWRDQHIGVLRSIANLKNPQSWSVYSIAMRELQTLSTTPIDQQRPVWNRLRSSLGSLKAR